MNEKFFGFTLFALIQYLDHKGIVTNPEFRDHCLKCAKFSEFTDQEQEEFRKYILRMPGVGLV